MIGGNLNGNFLGGRVLSIKIFNEMKLSAKHKIGIGIILATVFYVQFDMLIHLAIEGLHSAFELFEFSLDVLVEHLFHTDLHTTQVITFYLMLLIGGLVLYKVGRMVMSWYATFKKNLIDHFHQFYDDFLNYWRATSVMNRMKWWTVLMVCSGVLMLGLLS